MVTTSEQDRLFIDSIISSTLLEEAIEWIKRNLSPEDVFSEKELTYWAENAGMVQGEQ